MRTLLLRGRTAALTAPLALMPAAAHAAHTVQAVHPAPQAAPAPIVDFAGLSGARARSCDAPIDPHLAALGAPDERRCAWSGRVELDTWHGLGTPHGACLSAPALAWHRLNAAAGTQAPPWSAGWNAQARLTGGAAEQVAFAVWRDADGSWSAARWRWNPAEKADTRAWESAHWQDVVRTAGALAAANPAPPPSPLYQAWLDASNGKPRALDGDAWRWTSQATCFTLRTSGIGQAQLQLPWSRDDARLEQRTGMQVQLARRFPQAAWLTPFTLLDPALPAKRTGAKFVAVWQDGSNVQGQLWIPLKDGAGVLRARIAASLPAHAGADAAKRLGALAERELTAIAHAWEARHE